LRRSEIELYLAARPFRPLLIVTSDGHAHQVSHPEAAHVTVDGILHIYRGGAAEDRALPVAISLMHVTTLRVEQPE
jgi:hypothetical protein